MRYGRDIAIGWFVVEVATYISSNYKKNSEQNEKKSLSGGYCGLIVLTFLSARSGIADRICAYCSHQQCVVTLVLLGNWTGGGGGN